MTMETLDRLRSRITSIDSMPTIPVILRPLLHCLDQPVEQIDITRIVELISYDKSIAAQCVRMANSALFGRSEPVESVRTAVMNLGMWRVRDLLFSNSLTQVIPANRWIVEPTVFWRHSLGVALVCRKFAEILGYPDTEKAYLAGLLQTSEFWSIPWLRRRNFARLSRKPLVNKFPLMKPSWQPWVSRIAIPGECLGRLGKSP